MASLPSPGGGSERIRWQLRPVTADDRAAVQRLHRGCYHDVVAAQFGAWDDAVQDVFFEKRWAPERYRMVLLDGAVVGAVSAEQRPDCVYVLDIMIDPAFQNRGLGSSVIEHLAHEAATRGLPLRLQVLLKNRAAALYRRLGFCETGRTATHVLMERRAAVFGKPSDHGL